MDSPFRTIIRVVRDLIKYCEISFRRDADGTQIVARGALAILALTIIAIWLAI